MPPDALRPSLVTPAVDSVAGAYLALLAARGIEYLFGNAGTDFAPIVEALAQAQTSGVRIPRPITAVHEHLALSMAHGYAMSSGRTGAVMVHVSVGTANGVCAAMNAARENVPLLFTAGRTPILEEGAPGHRTSAIHWGQAMFDQAGMVREFVKWDYELRSPEQVETIVDRALAAARSEPKGPVYLSLPREVLAAPVTSFGFERPVRRVEAEPAGPDSAAVDEIAERFLAASHPLVITSNVGRDESAVARLAAFVQAGAVPVVQYRARYLGLPCDHSLHGDYDPAPWLADADFVLVLESDVPWVPATTSLRDECWVVHAGHDPLFLRYPVRGFRCDMALTTAPGALLEALTRRVDGRMDCAAFEARRAQAAAHRTWRTHERAARIEAVRGQSPIHPVWVSHCLSGVLPDEAIVVNEYPLSTEFCGFSRPGSFYASSTASGLGWGFGAALGAKLAHPERLVAATLGDGAYSVLESAGRALCGSTERAADPRRGLQQRDVERRSTCNPRDVSGRSCGAQRRAGVHAAGRLAGFRGRLHCGWRLRRAGRGAAGIAGRAGTRDRRGDVREAAGAAQRDVLRSLIRSVAVTTAGRMASCATRRTAGWTAGRPGEYPDAAHGAIAGGAIKGNGPAPTRFGCGQRLRG